MDKRVIKTKRDICNAFTELLAQKQINDITITEISEKALVNRKTVYKYYENVGDILSEIEDTLVESYEKIINALDISISLRDPYKIFEELTNVLNKNLDFYSKLMKINANSMLMNKLVQSLKVKVKNAFMEEKLIDPKDVDFVTDYVVSGMLAGYQRWFNSGMTIPLEIFSKKIAVLVYSGMSKFTLKKN